MKILKSFIHGDSDSVDVNLFRKADLSQFRRINLGGGNFILLLSATALAACGGGGGGGGGGVSGGGGGGISVSVPIGTTTRLSVSDTGLPSDQRFMDDQAPTGSMDGLGGFDELDLRGSMGADLDFRDNGARNIEIINSRNDNAQELQLSKDDVANFVGSELDDKEILIMRADSNDRISLGDADGWDLADGGLVDYQLASAGSRPQNYNLLQFESENIYIAVPQGVMVTQGDSGENINTGNSFNSNGDNIHFGSAGADNLVGGDGDNFIYGGLGNDTLESGNGDNFLWGGAGNDGFFISADVNGTSHVILDFTRGEDSLGTYRLSTELNDARNSLNLIDGASLGLTPQQTSAAVNASIRALEILFRMPDSEISNSVIQSVTRTQAVNAGFDLSVTGATEVLSAFQQVISATRNQASMKEIWRQVFNQDGASATLVDHANAEGEMVKAIQIDTVAGDYDLTASIGGMSFTVQERIFGSRLTIVPDGVDYSSMSSLTDGDITFNDIVSAIGSDALVYI